MNIIVLSHSGSALRLFLLFLYLPSNHCTAERSVFNGRNLGDLFRGVLDRKLSGQECLLCAGTCFPLSWDEIRENAINLRFLDYILVLDD